MPCDLDMEVGKWYTIDTGVKFNGGEGPSHLTRDDMEKITGARYIPVISRERYWFMMIVPRSGLSFKYGFKIRNTVAVIDQDFRDTIKLRVCIDGPIDDDGRVIPYELNENGNIEGPFKLHLKKDDRIAQGIVVPYRIFVDEDAPETERSGGYGSTGN